MTKKPTSEMFSDEALHFGSIAHYLDGAEYSAAYRRRTADVRWYLALADRVKAETVLELGGGAGRVAIPLGRQSHTVLAVDAVEGMIDEGRARLLREKPEVQARVTFALDDLRTFEAKENTKPSRRPAPRRGARGEHSGRPLGRLAPGAPPLPRAAPASLRNTRGEHSGRQFDLVIAPFNVMQHLYSRQDWEAALGVVLRHMAPKKGRFAFDITMPDLRAFIRDPARPYKCRPVRDVERNVIVESAESFAYDPVAQIQLVTTMTHDEGALETAYLKALAHRQVFPRELEALLHYNGFAVLERYGDFDGGPLDENAESQIIVAKAR